MSEPLIPRVPDVLRKHGWVEVATLATASIVVLGSASVWPTTARELLPLRVVLTSVLMVSAALVALALMPPERAATYKATPAVFRLWVVVLAGELALGVAVSLAYVSPEVRQLVGSLPGWARDGIAWLFFVPMMAWYASGCMLLGEMWHWARARFRRRSGRP